MRRSADRTDEYGRGGRQWTETKTETGVSPLRTTQVYGVSGLGHDMHPSFELRDHVIIATHAKESRMERVDRRPSDATARRALRREWEAAGRPPCRICEQQISDHEKTYASLVWNAVVHRLCSTVVGSSAVNAADCPETDRCTWPQFCPCPHASVVNAIVAAHRNGLASIDLPTDGSPGCVRAAKEAGFGNHHNAPLRESLWYENLLKHGTVLDETIWNRPSIWFEPPARLRIDVPGSIREGRIITRPGCQP